MNTDILQGNWEQLKGHLTKAWGKLTDDDLTQIEGNKQVIYGKLQEYYGYSKDEALKAVNDFQEKHTEN